MRKTVKFTISMPAAEFEALEAARCKAGKTRSQYIREALEATGAAKSDDAKEAEAARTGVALPEEERTSQARAKAGAGAIMEEPGPYRSPLPAHADITGMVELRRRAIEAAGRFESGYSDLSVDHDSHFAAAQDADQKTPAKSRGERAERPLRQRRRSATKRPDGSR